MAQGDFFPSSIKTLSDTSKTLNVLFNHMMRCRKCPPEVRETLEKLRTVHDEQRAKMKFGSQKAFFARIWDRLHDNDPHVDSRQRKFNQPKSPKTKKTPGPVPVQNNSASGNLASMQVGTTHLAQQQHYSYLEPENALGGSLRGLSTAEFLNFGVGINSQYTPSDSETNKRLKLQKFARSNQM